MTLHRRLVPLAATNLSVQMCSPAHLLRCQLLIVDFALNLRRIYSTDAGLRACADVATSAMAQFRAMVCVAYALAMAVAIVSMKTRTRASLTISYPTRRDRTTDVDDIPDFDVIPAVMKLNLCFYLNHRLHPNCQSLAIWPLLVIPIGHH